MGKFSRDFVWVVGSAFGALVMVAMQTPAETAVSNLSTYPKYFGFPHIAEWISNPTADTWAFWIGLLFFVGGILGFIHTRRKATRAESKEDEVKAPPQIEIGFEAGFPYEITELRGEHVFSAVRIGIKNAGGGVLSNCRVFVDRISPMPEIVGGLPLELEEKGFNIRSDDPEKIVEIASHWNHMNQLRFSAPAATFAEGINYIDDKNPMTFVVRVAATECQRSATFKLETDTEKALHLRFVGYMS